MCVRARVYMWPARVSGEVSVCICVYVSVCLFMCIRMFYTYVCACV